MDLSSAYQYCRRQAFGHYENFPVASLLFPAAQRGAVAAVYAFARQADDFADEWEYEGRRLEELDAWEARLHRHGGHPVFVALDHARRQFQIPLEPFQDLLSAFRQDVLVRRYRDREQLLDYCRRSANPVGRLVLQIAGAANEEAVRLSDSICTALQLANFWQDLGQDAQKRDRVYLPRETMKKHGATEGMLLRPDMAPQLRSCLVEECALARSLFEQGAALPAMLGGRLGLEIRLTLAGGLRVLERIRLQDYDTLSRRPALGRRDWVAIGLGLLRRSPGTAA